ncbi:MAG: VOC family protein [Proteobacteria bacterium]|nr:VOC family protein [Pseudomonadota bacterium]
MPSLNHVGLTVADLEESLGFYRDLVGMKEIGPVQEISGEWFDLLTENQGADLRVAHLELAGLRLQLVEYVAAAGERLSLLHRHVGNPHLCIDVEDLEGRYERIRADGRHKTSPLVTIAETAYRSFYVTDPNGVLVEFIQAGPPDPA